MKTKQLFLFAFAFLITCAASLQSQNFLVSETPLLDLDVLSVSSNSIDLESYEVNTEDYTLEYSVENAPKSITENDAQSNVVAYALSMIALGAGFGVNADQTLWCLHAEYYLRLAMLNRAAIYGSVGATYNGSSSDFLTTTIFDVTLKVLMFTQLAKQYQQVRFLYGLAAAYGFGKEKFEDGFSYDITRLTMSLVIGFQIMLTQQWALMIQSNLLNYQELTRTFEDFETKAYSRWALINKNNLLALSLIYTFANSKR